MEDVRGRGWYVLGYFGITSLIELVIKLVFRHTTRAVLYAMFYPGILTWKMVRRLTRSA